METGQALAPTVTEVPLEEAEKKRPTIVMRTPPETGQFDVPLPCVAEQPDTDNTTGEMG